MIEYGIQPVIERIDIDNFEEKEYSLENIGLENYNLIFEKNQIYIQTPDDNFPIYGKDSFKEFRDEYVLSNGDISEPSVLNLTKEQYEIIVSLL